MVAANIGITLMPQLARHSNDGLSYIPFNHPKPSRIIGVTWRQSSARKALIGELVNDIKNSLKQQTDLKII